MCRPSSRDWPVSAGLDTPFPMYTNTGRILQHCELKSLNMISLYSCQCPSSSHSAQALASPIAGVAPVYSRGYFLREAEEDVNKIQHK